MFIQIIDNLFNNNLMKGIAISGLLAVLMSTADSFVHSSGLVVYNDIYKGGAAKVWPTYKKL
ncbi:MAG: hypothetical protein GY830_10355 [Bacteroidetes bacterium]|nr:hypothetical protein [Bacteroidota bacterium]